MSGSQVPPTSPSSSPSNSPKPQDEIPMPQDPSVLLNAQWQALKMLQDNLNKEAAGKAPPFCFPPGFTFYSKPTQMQLPYPMAPPMMFPSNFMSALNTPEVNVAPPVFPPFGGPMGMNPFYEKGVADALNLHRAMNATSHQPAQPPSSISADDALNAVKMYSGDSNTPSAVNAEAAAAAQGEHIPPDSARSTPEHEKKKSMFLTASQKRALTREYKPYYTTQDCIRIGREIGIEPMKALRELLTRKRQTIDPNLYIFS